MARKRLPVRRSDGRFLLKRGLSSSVRWSEIMKWPEGVCDQPGIVRHILEASKRFKFTGEVIGNFTEAGSTLKAQYHVPRSPPLNRPRR